MEPDGSVVYKGVGVLDLREDEVDVGGGWAWVGEQGEREKEAAW